MFDIWSQRTFVGVDFFTVFQEINLETDDPRVNNIVKFSEAIGELKVEVGMSSISLFLYIENHILLSYQISALNLPYVCCIM